MNPAAPANQAAEVEDLHRQSEQLLPVYIGFDLAGDGDKTVIACGLCFTPLVPLRAAGGRSVLVDAHLTTGRDEYFDAARHAQHRCMSIPVLNHCKPAKE